MLQVSRDGPRMWGSEDVRERGKRSAVEKRPSSDLSEYDICVSQTDT